MVQQKTSRPVQFEITESTRMALTDWIRLSGLAPDDFLFPSCVHAANPRAGRHEMDSMIGAMQDAFGGGLHCGVADKAEARQQRR